MIFKILIATVLCGVSACIAQVGPIGYGPILFGTSPLPTLTFQANVTLTGGSGGISAGRTYTSVAIGPAASNRTVIIADGFRDAGICPLASLTVGGIAATRVAQNVNSATNTTITSIWVAAVPTGTTATIVSVYCASVDSAEGLGVYAAYGLGSTTPIATVGNSSATAPSLNLNVLSGGMVIATAWALGQTTPMCTWTGVTADYSMITDPTSTSQVMAGASASLLAAASPRTVSCTYGVTSAGEASASAASFR